MVLSVRVRKVGEDITYMVAVARQNVMSVCCVMLCCGINLPVIVRVLSCSALSVCLDNIVANGIPRPRALN